MGTRIYIETWGCQMNLHQSEGMAGVLERAGHAIVDRLEDADVVLFNGCMVRGKAEEKLLGRIGAVVEEKRRRDVVFGVGGCFGQVHGDSLFARSRAIDFVFGTRQHLALPDLIDQARRNKRASLLSAANDASLEETPFRRTSAVTAMVTITEGCSNACAYCVVPPARGPMRSRDLEAILAEVRSVVRDGHRQVLLLGQNVNAYGRDRPAVGNFARLLERVSAAGPARIRFTSSHPRDMTQEILDVMAGHANVCRHLHLALQSGSDRVLGAMNRGYGRDSFFRIAEAARRTLPGINLTTDLIVGFPGETASEFEETLDVVREVRFGSIYAAKYSPRPLTRAAELPDDVSRDEKERRLARVLEVERAIAAEENVRFVGRTLTVLVEGEADGGRHFGRADDHRTVVVEGEVDVGELALVTILRASASALTGAVQRVGDSVT
ncbi:MAG: tRNA (N6-isopentenyl adenosine(37)-C2)-methylthiotransferase MiaB [bacterium]